MPLSAWRAFDPGFRQRRIACVGSSTTQGTSPGSGGWPEDLRLLMQHRWGKAGVGLVQMFREGWTTSGWTAEPNGGAGDCGSSNGAVVTASTAATIATYTVGSNQGIAADGFYLYFMDKAGSGTPSYSVDGGAFVNVPGITFTGSSNVKKSTLISTAYTSTVRVRAGNAAGTDQQVSIHGIEPVDLTGSDVNGCTVDNMGRNADFLVSPTRDAAGPLLKTLTVANPDLMTVMYTNDLLFWGGGGGFFSTALNTLYTACALVSCDLVPMVYWAREDVDTPQELADQDDLRSRVHTFADANDLAVIDLRDGYETFADADAAGFLDGGGVHPTALGCDYIADQLWRLIGRTGAETFVRS